MSGRSGRYFKIPDDSLSDFLVNIVTNGKFIKKINSTSFVFEHNSTHYGIDLSRPMMANPVSISHRDPSGKMRVKFLVAGKKTKRFNYDRYGRIKMK